MNHQLGQLLLIELPKAAWNSGLERLLQRVDPAGYVFRKLTTATRKVCANCAHATSSTPFLAIEQEGSGTLSDLFPTLAQSARFDLSSAERTADLIGRTMVSVGLNVNLAPIVDLDGSSMPGKGGALREARPDLSPDEIARRAEAFIRGLARHRILACARHFPGRPASAGSRSAPLVDKPMAALWREDLVPYRAIGAKCPMIEVTHAVHKAYEYEFLRPSSLSSTVATDLLRTKLGYEGVALADASSAARAAGIDLTEAAVRAVAAGCDLVLVPCDEKPVAAVLDSLRRAIEIGTLSHPRIEEALGRVKAAKEKLAKPGKLPSEGDLSKFQRELVEHGKRGGPLA